MFRRVWNKVRKKDDADGFLMAVLCNNLIEAVARADEENLAALKEIVTYCYMELPSSSWKSEELVQNWMKRKAEKHNGERSGETYQRDLSTALYDLLRTQRHGP